MLKDKRWQRRLGLVLFWVAAYFFMVWVSGFFRVRGTDWYDNFRPRQDLYDYPPWLYVLLALLPDLPFLSGLTLTALLFVLWRRQAKLPHILLAFASLPVVWVLTLAQVDAVPMLGLALLPWGIPLVMLKPQVGFWYVWAWWRQRPDRWKIALGTLAFVALTFVIWGLWPLRWHPPATVENIHNISLWKTCWPLAVVALIGALVEPDPDRAMALGALAVPYIQGASYIVLLPALTRLRGPALVIVWATTWIAAFVLLVGEWLHPWQALFPFALWAALAWQAWAEHRRKKHEAVAAL